MALSKAFRDRFREQAAHIEGIDTEIYRRFGKDPLEPIIGAGERTARIGFFGRDPGREEVRHGEPFIGSGGRIVRKVLYQHLHGEPAPDFEALRALGRGFFWINTVPYKPVGNKAWSMAVKRRFHPLMSRLLIEQWDGRDVITLGREAFLWFGLEQSRETRETLEAFWAREARFNESLEVELRSGDEARTFRLHPLPHPSPLNQTWFKRFPDLLRARLDALDVKADETAGA